LDQCIYNIFDVLWKHLAHFEKNLMNKKYAKMLSKQSNQCFSLFKGFFIKTFIRKWWLYEKKLFIPLHYNIMQYLKSYIKIQTI
jgi:hypothetical protein